MLGLIFLLFAAQVAIFVRFGRTTNWNFVFAMLAYLCASVLPFATNATPNWLALCAAMALAGGVGVYRGARETQATASWLYAVWLSLQIPVVGALMTLWIYATGLSSVARWVVPFDLSGAAWVLAAYSLALAGAALASAAYRSKSGFKT